MAQQGHHQNGDQAAQSVVADLRAPDLGTWGSGMGPFDSPPMGSLVPISYPLTPFLPLNEAVSSRAVIVIASGSGGRVGGNAFGAS